ncbi:MAG: M3 family oligoendopeptidase [Ardenticatenaceae bacterium]|nr:M3 family oligoendopeptidase [Ardenticatenaceae bacterium]
MSSENGKLPQWDMSVVYSGLDSPEFEADFQAIIQAIADLATFFDDETINRVEAEPENVVATLETAVTRYNTTLDKLYTLYVYILSFVVTNSRNNQAQARLSELQQHLARLSLMGTRLTAWLGSLNVNKLIEQSAVARDHAYILHRAQQAASHLMAPIEEALAADLTLTGSSSWRQLFNTYVSQLSVDIELEGETKKLPLTAAQNLSYNPDRDVRRRAHEAVEATLKSAIVPCAAALNSLKGESLTLTQKRGWDSPLDEVLFDNVIDRTTLDAMMTAVRHAYPDMRRYLKAKARALGLPILKWYDRLVPLGQSSQSWSYRDAQTFVIEQFATYSPRLSEMAQRAFSENWIDSAPGDGKRGGAFCIWLRQGESRILTNFEPSFTAVGTLAHELGHAYHNLNLINRTPLQREMPMTLAETASTFCQKIVEEAALAAADDHDKRIILDGRLEYAVRVLLGAPSDFAFETNLFERRKQRALSPDELCELMHAAQKETFGDAVDNDYLYPYRWVYVPHFYGSNYYNFPYIFGLLFGLGLYAYYQTTPDQFKAGYDDLLASTGMGNAAELAARFGINIRDTAFWNASLDVLRGDIAAFDHLVGE